jgi:hypothetical protein
MLLEATRHDVQGCARFPGVLAKKDLKVLFVLEYRREQCCLETTALTPFHCPCSSTFEIQVSDPADVGSAKYLVSLLKYSSKRVGLGHGLAASGIREKIDSHVQRSVSLLFLILPNTDRVDEVIVKSCGFPYLPECCFLVKAEALRINVAATACCCF